MTGDEAVDVRLVPAALAVWGVAAVAVVLPSAGAGVAGGAVAVAGVVVACVAGAGLAGAGRSGARRRGGGRGGVGRGAGGRGGVGRRGGERGGVVRRGGEWGGRARHAGARSAGAHGGGASGQAVLVLGAVAALLLALAAQARAREAGDLRGLAEDRATVRLVGTVRSTPLPVGPPPAPEEDPAAARAGPVRFLLAARSVEVVGGTGPAAGPARGAGPRATGAAVEVLAPATAGSLAYGTEVAVVARLAPVGDPARRAVARARAADDPVTRAPPTALLRGTERLRAGLVGTAAAVPGDAGRLLPAVAVGDTRGVGDLDEAMKVSGLAHLTAVSGAHFSLLGGVVRALAARCRVPRRWRWLPVGAVMLGFVALVQPGASVVRAAVMGAVGVLGLVAGRPARSVPALAGAVLVLVVVDPWLARDIGFVLSVVTTAGIALLAGPLARRWSTPAGRGTRATGRSHRVRGRWAAECGRAHRGAPGGGRGTAGSGPGAGRSTAAAIATAVAVPVAAQAVCAPVVLLLSPAVPTYAVLANLAVTPAVAPGTVGGLVAALLAPWWPAAATWCAQAAGAACWWIAAVARTATALPGAQLAWAEGVLGIVLLATASGAALVLALRCRRDVAP